MTSRIDFGWVLLLAALAGLIPTLRALLRTRRLTRVRAFRLHDHSAAIGSEPNQDIRQIPRHLGEKRQVR